MYGIALHKKNPNNSARSNTRHFLILVLFEDPEQ